MDSDAGWFSRWFRGGISVVDLRRFHAWALRPLWGLLSGSANSASEIRRWLPSKSGERGVGGGWLLGLMVVSLLAFRFASSVTVGCAGFGSWFMGQFLRFSHIARVTESAGGSPGIGFALPVSKGMATKSGVL